MKEFATIILAAGKGTRMKSKLAKVLHLHLGRPMVGYVVMLAQEVGSSRIIAVVGYQGKQVQRTLEKFGIEFAFQNEQLGTGHAVLQAEKNLADFHGDVLVLSGDVPLLSTGTISRMIQLHNERNFSATMLTAETETPSGYGRIIRDSYNGFVQKIVEEKDASREERKIREINAGTYIFDKEKLFSALREVKADNVQGEYYLTDVISILRSRGEPVAALKTDDFDETRGVNTIEQLKMAEEILKARFFE